MMEARACALLVVLGCESAALSLGPAKKDEESANPLVRSRVVLARRRRAYTRRMLAQGIGEGNQWAVISAKDSEWCSYPRKRRSVLPSRRGPEL
jgi:hypothetical protein